MSTPMTTASSVDTMPTSSETRAPYTRADEDVAAETVGAEEVVAVRPDRQAVVGDAELAVAEVGVVADPLARSVAPAAP